MAARAPARVVPGDGVGDFLVCPHRLFHHLRQVDADLLRGPQGHTHRRVHLSEENVVAGGEDRAVEVAVCLQPRGLVVGVGLDEMVPVQ